MTTTDNHNAPTQQPPTRSTTTTTGDAGAAAGPSPQRTSPKAGSTAGTSRSRTSTAAGPTLLPPPRSDAGSSSGTATASVWQNDKAITGMWSDAGTRNAWALVDGVGWRKIFAGTDGAFMALTLLAGQAHQSGRHVNYREDDQVVTEIYLW